MAYLKCWNCSDICKHRTINNLFTYFTITNVSKSNLHLESNENNSYQINFKKLRLNKERYCKNKIYYTKDMFLSIPLYLSKDSKKKIKNYISNIKKCRYNLKNHLEEKYKDSNLCLYPSIEESCKTFNSSLNYEPPFELQFDKGIGIFCSIPCMWSYINNFYPFNSCISIRNEAEKCIAIYIRYILLHTIGVSNNVYIPSILSIYPEKAPNISIMKEFGGTIERQKYRNMLNDIMDRCVKKINIHIYNAYNKYIYDYNNLNKKTKLYIKVDISLHSRNPLPIIVEQVKETKNKENDKINKTKKYKEDSKIIQKYYKTSSIMKQEFRSLPTPRTSISSIYAFL